MLRACDCRRALIIDLTKYIHNSCYVTTATDTESTLRDHFHSTVNGYILCNAHNIFVLQCFDASKSNECLTLTVTNHGSKSAVRHDDIIRTGSNINGSLTSLVEIMITLANDDFKNCVFISLYESFRGTL